MRATTSLPAGSTLASTSTCEFSPLSIQQRPRAWAKEPSGCWTCTAAAWWWVTLSTIPRFPILTKSSFSVSCKTFEHPEHEGFVGRDDDPCGLPPAVLACHLGPRPHHPSLCQRPWGENWSKLEVVLKITFQATQRPGLSLTRKSFFGEFNVAEIKMAVTIILILDLINQVKSQSLQKSYGFDWVLLFSCCWHFCSQVIWGLFLALRHYQVIHIVTSII